MRNDEVLLLDMLIAARKIIRFMEGIDQQNFLANELVQSAVIRELQVLGEAARMLSDAAKATHAHIPWHVIAGMRNRLIHEYFGIRLPVVWDTAHHDIPALVVQLERIVPPDDEDSG